VTQPAPPLPTDRGDPLGAALEVLRFSGTFYCCAELTTPWGIALPAFPGCLIFHVVTAGRCWLSVPGAEPRWVEAGSLVLVPQGDAHSARSEPCATDAPLFEIPSQKLSERCEVMRYGGPAPLRRLARGPESPSTVCRTTTGVVRFEHDSARELVGVLPRVLEVVPANDDEGSWLESTIRFMAREATALRPGAETVLTRLADILVIQGIRTWLGSAGPEERGYLAGLVDAQLGRALLAMHRHPERSWQVATLARAAGMSRSAFAARFSELCGKPAMAYLTELRLHLARRALRETSDPVAALAYRFGYQSEAAFTRAFKRAFGTSPRGVRTGRESSSANPSS
jgi:AraC-like DNA-binding protein